ncbi:MAG: NUDIX hydrolase, partial [Opitutales bacterium]|nr:NUDIX hydrolase [Opitutales bacterium]
ARREGTAGAVCVIAHTGGESPRLLLIRQFRPPVGREVLEFPAGLLDAGETAEAAALRELQEETGWTGAVVRVGPCIPSSPGMTDEWVRMVEVLLNEGGRAQPDGDEEITPVWVPCAGLREALESFDAEGVMVDAKLWSFAAGMAFAVGAGRATAQ